MYKFALKLLVILALPIILSSCQTASLSLEKAKQVTTTFEGETFKRPPKTIRDITAILDQQGVEISPKIIQLRRQASLVLPDTKDNFELALFYLKRSRARQDLGILKKATVDALLAYKYYLEDPNNNSFSRQNHFQLQRFAALAERRMGNLKRYIEIIERAADQPKTSFSQHRALMNAYLASGDFENAKKAREDSEYRAKKTINSKHAPARSRAFARVNLTLLDVTMLESEGRWKDAEPLRKELIVEAKELLRLAEDGNSQSSFPPIMGPSAKWDRNKNNLIEASEIKGGPLHANFKTIDCDKSGALDMNEIRGFFRKTGCPRKESPGSYQLGKFSPILVGLFKLRLAENLVRQGRTVEAESIVRETLLSTLKRSGKTSLDTVLAVNTLAGVMSSQGRDEEALQLGKAALKILSDIETPSDSKIVGTTKFKIARNFSRLGKWKEASDLFHTVSKEMVENRMAYLELERKSSDLPLTLIKTGAAEGALKLLRPQYEVNKKRLGIKHFRTAKKGALIAATLTLQGKKPEALKLFQSSIPILLSRSRQSNNSETENVASTRQNRILLESYIKLLASIRGTELEQTAGIDAAAEAFRIADIARSGSVQGALASSGARAAVDNKDLSDLIRREQDARKQIAALFSLQANVLSSPVNQQDPAALLRLRTQIDSLRGARAIIAQEIEKRFPLYAELINPKPTTVAKVQKSLVADEALIATYVVEDKTYVWTVTKTGKASLHVAPLGSKRVAAVAKELRKALDPQAATLGDIPVFNTRLSYRLYRTLLKSGEKKWKPAKSLLIVPHGALAQLPFGVLVTGKKPLPKDQPPIFSNYKEIPWLIRSHSVTVLPSVTALASLRALPKPKKGRRPFVGFGDPYFSVKQATDAGKPKEVKVAALTSRGLLKTRGVRIKLRSAPKTQGLDSADLSLLPRLPDTFDEVRSIAVAINADLTRDVFTGKRANEDVVKKLNLSGYKVVIFATHGLVPGDLDGLRQPALALSTPKLGGYGGDGLLTMDEILGLKLDADWVVLSACNTASAEGAGAEAFSGLGRAFFYAGTRAMLLSNWPVETTSAQKLTTDLFSRQAKDKKLSRAKALQQAMLALIDGDGYKDGVSGKIVFSYAHPIFWAPFSLVGDGGV